MRLKGKRALVTGAASGIGRASAILFAAEGAQVLAVDLAEGVEETRAAIEKAGGRCWSGCVRASSPARRSTCSIRNRCPRATRSGPRPTRF